MSVPWKSAIYAPVLVSIPIWLVACFKYGQVHRLAYLHRIAVDRKIAIKDPDTRTSLDGLGDRRMTIIGNVIQGAAFVGTAGALILQTEGFFSTEALAVLVAILSLLVAWGACNEAGGSHTFYVLSLTARKISREGYRRDKCEWLKPYHLSLRNPSTIRISGRLTYLGAWVDALWFNTISTQSMFLASGAMLLGWWSNLVGCSVSVTIGILTLFFVAFGLLVGWGIGFEYSLRKQFEAILREREEELKNKAIPYSTFLFP